MRQYIKQTYGNNAGEAVQRAVKAYIHSHQLI